MIVLPKSDSESMNPLRGENLNPEDPSLSIDNLQRYVKSSLKCLKKNDLSNELPDTDVQ